MIIKEKNSNEKKQLGHQNQENEAVYGFRYGSKKRSRVAADDDSSAPTDF